VNDRQPPDGANIRIGRATWPIATARDVSRLSQHVRSAQLEREKTEVPGDKPAKNVDNPHSQ